MRVLIVSREYPPTSEGGISRRLSNLVPRLMDKGVEIGIVCFGGSSLAGERVYSLDAKSNILYTRSGEPPLSDLASVLADIWRLNKHATCVASSKNYDIVQLEDPVFGPFLSSKVPNIVTVHTTQLGEFYALCRVFNNPRQMKRLLFSGSLGWIFDRLSLRHADVVVAVGPEIRAELQRSYGVPERKLRVILNGVDVPETLQKAEAKEKMGISGPLLLYAGRLVDRKRVDDFLKALAKLRDANFKDFSAFVVGSGPAKDFLVDLARRLRLTDCVKFTGYVDDDVYFNFLEAADIFVLPSCYEGLPIAAMEAMAYGCFPVVTDIMQMRGIIRTGENGVTFAVGDVEALSKALHEIVIDDKSRASIYRISRKKAMHFSWDTAASGYLQIYEALLGKGHLSWSEVNEDSIHI